MCNYLNFDHFVIKAGFHRSWLIWESQHSGVKYYSNFKNKYHYKDFHRVRCTEPTPKWHLITLDVFLQIRRNCQWLLKMQWATAFNANHSLDGPMDACKFSKFRFIFCPLFQKIRKMKCVLEEFIRIIVFKKVSVSNHLDPDQGGHSIGVKLGPNCLQRLSADDESRH